MQRYGFTLEPAIHELESNISYLAMEFDDDIPDIDIDIDSPPVLRLTSTVHQCLDWRSLLDMIAL